MARNLLQFCRYVSFIREDSCSIDYGEFFSSHPDATSQDRHDACIRDCSKGKEVAGGGISVLIREARAYIKWKTDEWGTYIYTTILSKYVIDMLVRSSGESKL